MDDADDDDDTGEKEEEDESDDVESEGDVVAEEPDGESDWEGEEEEDDDDDDDDDEVLDALLLRPWRCLLWLCLVDLEEPKCFDLRASDERPSAPFALFRVGGPMPEGAGENDAVIDLTAVPPSAGCFN